MLLRPELEVGFQQAMGPGAQNLRKASPGHRACPRTVIAREGGTRRRGPFFRAVNKPGKLKINFEAYGMHAAPR